MAATITTVRIDPEIIDLLKKVTGKTEKAAAIREAIHDKINSDNSHILHTLHIDMRDVVTVEVAAQLLKLHRCNVYRKLKSGKLTGTQPGGKKSTWYVHLDSLKVLLLPKINKTS